MERNFLLTIEYDGSNFSGWQRQPSARTVQGELEKVLSKVCGGKVELNGTSRTDAGVHALGQRASFKGEYGIPTDRIMAAANDCLFGGRRLGGALGDVRITAVEEKLLKSIVPSSFTRPTKIFPALLLPQLLSVGQERRIASLPLIVWEYFNAEIWQLELLLIPVCTMLPQEYPTSAFPVAST